MTTDKNAPGGIIENFRSSQLLRLLLVGFLVLLVQIPVNMISGVVGERQSRRCEAVNEVTSTWGAEQNIIGPMLTVPYNQKISETDKDGVVRARTELRYAVFLPETLSETGSLKSQVRYRGIFKVPLYSLSLDVKGSFARPDFSEWGIRSEDVLWDRAYLSIWISDARAITNQVALLWNGKDFGFLPGTGDFDGKMSGIHAPLKGQLNSDSFAFACHLDLNGSGGVRFAPFGRDTTVALASNWPDPSFQGNWLPTERAIGKDGFTAKWVIPFLGRNYPQKWQGSTETSDDVFRSVFGVDVIAPVDFYRMSERSVKYEVLFLSLTFLVLWLFEKVAKLKIHPIQYLLVGAGMCLFYLLELSLAEHIGFDAAYGVASLAVTALIFFYCIFVLGGFIRSLILGVILLLIYGYLYVLLMFQDYALLIGSVCLFLALAAVMWITRKIDWYSPKTLSGDSSSS